VPDGVYIMQGDSVILPCDTPHIHLSFSASIMPSGGLSAATNPIFMPLGVGIDRTSVSSMGGSTLVN
jgi:hypothetical protein